jgi:hypothetical protein
MSSEFDVAVGGTSWGMVGLSGLQQHTRRTLLWTPKRIR